MDIPGPLSEFLFLQLHEIAYEVAEECITLSTKHQDKTRGRRRVSYSLQD